MCGATDCPSCGPAQGYFVERGWRGGRLTWLNPDDDEEDRSEPPEDDEAVPA
jgi:hypothetical protein